MNAAVSPAAALEADDAAWDAFVVASPHGSYLQLRPWADAKAVNGRAAARFVADGSTGSVGGQVLMRRARPLPWAFAYAPRGPVTGIWSGPGIEAWTARLRVGLHGGRGPHASHLRIDPEIERDGPDDPDGSLRRALELAGWRPAPKIQPETTRLIDLRADEAALWGDLRKKWRQYVNKARSGGIVVVEAGGERLGGFYPIISAAAGPAGFPVPPPSAHPTGPAQ